MDDRQRDIYESYQKGEALDHIASQYGISYIRAYQLYQKAKKEIEREALIKANSDILNPVLEALPLSQRARNCLSSIGAKELADLLELTEGQILSIPNCGKTTLEEIKSYLKANGWKLKE